MRLLVFCGDLLLSDTRELLSNARLFIRAGFEGDPVSFESGWFPIFYLRLFAPHTLSSSFLSPPLTRVWPQRCLPRTMDGISPPI
jgi:hypothetical protein